MSITSLQHFLFYCQLPTVFIFQAVSFRKESFCSTPPLRPAQPDTINKERQRSDNKHCISKERLSSCGNYIEIRIDSSAQEAAESIVFTNKTLEFRWIFEKMMTYSALPKSTGGMAFSSGATLLQNSVFYALAKKCNDHDIETSRGTPVIEPVREIQLVSPVTDSLLSGIRNTPGSAKNMNHPEKIISSFTLKKGGIHTITVAFEILSENA